MLTYRMTQPPPPRGRILVAEDVASIALVISRVLTSAGYEVEVVTDGQTCLEEALTNIPDLVILDIMMPRLHGLAVLRRLREDPRTHSLKALVCSAKDFRTERDEAMSLGAGFLVKPFNPEVLVAQVDALMGYATSTIENADTPEKPAVYHPKLDPRRPQVQFWGTRGSSPTIGGAYVRHGGNTSCMALTVGDDLLIFDAGSGLRELGSQMMAESRRKAHLFITHTHWDHIQGYPFFTPAYVPGFELSVLGCAGLGRDLEDIFRGQLARDYFPVQLEDMLGSVRFAHLPSEPPLVVGDASISWEYTHHPLPALAYKIEVGGRSVAWVPDNEFVQGYTGPPGALHRDHPIVVPHQKLIDFLVGTDIVIHEAQYSTEEYPNRIGWGHSSVSNAAALIKLAGIRHWIVTHHDPAHTDEFLERQLLLTRQVLEDIGHSAHVTHAYDGMIQLL